jgi:hypothetical protein
MLEAGEGSLSLVNRLADLKVRESIISARFLAVPKLNYIDAKAKIESLNTQHLAERIDERLIEFHDNKRNDAMALGKINRVRRAVDGTLRRLVPTGHVVTGNTGIVIGYDIHHAVELIRSGKILGPEIKVVGP